MMNPRNEYEPGDIQVLGPGVILLRGAAVFDNAALIARAIKTSPGSPLLGRFRVQQRAFGRALDLAGVSPERNDETKSVDDESDSETWEDEPPISTTEAAALLGVSPRRVQQLAPDLGAWRIGRAYCLDRRLVLAHRDRMKRGRDGE